MDRQRALKVLGVGVGLAALAAMLILGPLRSRIERLAVVLLEAEYIAPDGPFEPVFDGPDAERARVSVQLVPVAEGFSQPVDLQFVPGMEDVALVAEKRGLLKWVRTSTGEVGEVHRFDVLTASEQGLLGLAFHPDFPAVSELFVNVVQSIEGQDRTRVLRCGLTGVVGDGGRLDGCELVLEQAQPYQNHNAGQLAFGPDGMLYIGFGDGGLRDDPNGAGQDPGTWLGKMLRVDVRTAPYVVPSDNPFVGLAGYKPEIWALGLRNPWRYGFAPDGRLVIADVGQDTWEEVSIAGRGANLGWALREGEACYPDADDCLGDGLTVPVWTYGRDAGVSVTGGYVATGEAVPGLRGRYVLGDFATGRLWALDLDSRDVRALGRWPVLPSSFGRDAAGDVYIVGFGRGTIYRLARGE